MPETGTDSDIISTLSTGAPQTGTDADILGGGAPTDLGNTDMSGGSWLGNMLRSAKGAGRDALEGLGARAVINPSLNIVDLIRRAAGKETMMDTPQAHALTDAPQSIPGKVGGAVGDILPFFAPEVAGLGKVRSAITAGATASLPDKIASIVGRSGLEAGANAGVSLAESGDPHAAMTSALVSGALGSMGAAAEQPLINRATKMEAAALKPSLSISNSVNAPPGEGAEAIAKNVFKYDLGGSLKDTAAKTISAIRDRATQLGNLLKTNPATYNLHDAIDQTEQDLLGTMQARAKNATFLPEVKNALAKFRSDADQIAPAQTQQVPTVINGQIRTTMPSQTVTVTPAGQADLLSANGFKRSVGHETNFQYGQQSRDQQGLEIVANNLYSKLRQGIETAAGNAGPLIKKINGELGDLIPIERAVVRRLPIDYRQNMVSLGTAMTALPAIATGDLRKLVLPLAYQASKSPRLANILQKGATAVPGLTGKLASAGISQSNENQ